MAKEKILNSSIPWQDCIGKTVTAQPPAIAADGIRIEENPGQPDAPYVDVFQNGRIIYMFGEEVVIEGFDPGSGTVLMYNGSEDLRFTLPHEQYVRDFGTNWSIEPQLRPYRIAITETYVKEVEIYAEDEWAAEEIAEELCNEDVITFDYENFIGRSTECRGISRPGDLSIHEVYCQPKALDPVAPGKVLAQLSKTIHYKLLDELAETAVRHQPFIDVCVEARFPVDFYPNHTLVVWGEENDVDDKFYSVGIYKNGPTGKPDEQILSVMSNSTGAQDLNIAIHCAVNEFAHKRAKSNSIEAQKSRSFNDVLHNAETRAAAQQAEQGRSEPEPPTH